MNDQTQKNAESRGNSREFSKKTRKSSPSIRRLLLVYIILFFSSMLIVLWLLQTVFMDDFYRAIKKKEIKEAYERISLISPYDTNSSDEAKTVADEYGVCVSVYSVTDSTSAVTLFSAHTLSHCTIHNTEGSSKFKLYSAAVERGGVFFQYFGYDPQFRVFSSIPEDEVSSGADEVSMIYVRVMSGATENGGDIMVILNSVITPVSATVSTIYVQLGLFTVLFILMSALFVWIISRRFTAPLAKLTESARNFGSAQIPEQRSLQSSQITDESSYNGFNANGYREIEMLSDTLNYASEELIKNDRLRRELMANFSHDLRTPLTMIIGYGEMMRDIPGESTPENAANIVSEAERLNLLVNDMLELSKLQTGTAELKITEFSLTELVCDAVTRYGELMSHEGYTITFERNENGTDANVAIVESDASRLGRVLQNLVGNAIQHSGENKTVTVRQIINNGWVTIAVRDRGEGIPAEKLPFLWERYYKVNSAHKRSSKGTGLGLSIVKATMEQLGGHYGVESKVGEGSTFWFAIKLSDKEK